MIKQYYYCRQYSIEYCDTFLSRQIRMKNGYVQKRKMEEFSEKIEEERIMDLIDIKF